MCVREVEEDRFGTSMKSKNELQRRRPFGNDFVFNWGLRHGR